MTQRTVNEVWAGPSTGTPSLRQLLVGVWETLEVWQQRGRERTALLSIDDRGLRDVGLTRSDVLRECRKPFWRE